MGDLRDISTELGGKEAALRLSLYRALSRAVQDAVADKPQASVLDVGCGRGELMKSLAELGYRCYGMDVEVECVRMSAAFGKAELGGFSDIETIRSSRWPDVHMNVVVSSHVLEHVDNPLDCLRHMRSIDAEKYIFAIPNVLRSIRIVRALLGSPRADHPTHVYGWTRPEFTALLLRAGFRVTEWYCDRVTLNPLSGRVGSGLTRMMSPLETRLLPHLFPMLASSLIVACERAE